MNRWLDQVAGLVEFLKNSPRAALTFLIGAGTSISSGGPTTPQVETKLTSVHGSFDANTELTAAEKETVQSLFAGFSPYIGYHALAAMALTRPVFVLNLNWDDGLEQAARAVGLRPKDIESISIYDSDSVVQLQDSLRRERHRGLVIVHLHGRLHDGNYHFSRLETLTFPDPGRSLIKQFLRHTTLIIGTSLRTDADMTQILAETPADGPGTVGPVWLFSRESRTFQKDTTLARMFAARNCDPAIVEDDTLDFDRLLLHLHTESSGQCYADFVSRHYPGSPQFAKLVFPRPDMIRPLLDRRAILLIDDPQVGKTRIGCLLAFFFKTCFASNDEDVEVIVARGLPAYGVLVNSDGILHLDRPFGLTEFQDNPDFLNVLARKATAKKTKRNRHTRIIVECTPAAWAHALEKSPDVARKTTFDDDNLEGWYDVDQLLALIESEDREIAQAIRDKVLRAPGEVITALESRVPLPRRSDEAIAEKRTHLGSLKEYGRLIALVRLQHLAAECRPWRNLVIDAGFHDPQTALKKAGRWVETFRVDEHEFARLRDVEDAALVDEQLDDQRTVLATDVQRLQLHSPWITEALRVRNLARAVRNRDAALVRALHGEQHETAPMLLQVAGDDWPLQFIAHKEMDLWILRDFAFEFVRLWRRLRTSPRARAILGELVNLPQGEGLYAVLEAALFLRDMTHGDIWEFFGVPLLELVRDVERGHDAADERRQLAAMVFDGLLWRNDPTNNSFASTWFKRFFEAVDEKSDLAGAFAFSLVYHGNAAAEHLHEKRLGQHVRLERLNRLTPSQAKWFCWMMQWHLEHECRDRAIMLRRDQLSKTYLKYLRRNSYGDAPPGETPILLAALRSLKQAGYAGWAFHLAVNLMTVEGRYGSEVTDELSGLLDAAGVADTGILLAVMNYSVDPVLDKVQQYFRQPHNRRALLDAFARGITCNNLMNAPKFDYCRDPFDVMRMLDIRWPALERLGAPMTRDEFLPWLHDLAEHASIEADRRHHVRAALKLAARGDLRQFEEAAERLLETRSADAARGKLIAAAVGAETTLVRASADASAAAIAAADLPTTDSASEWLRRFEEITTSHATANAIGVLGQFIAAADVHPILSRRLADAYAQRARLRVRSPKKEENAPALIKNDLREAIRLHRLEFKVNEAQKLEAELRQVIWDNDLKPTQKRPSRTLQEKINLYSADVVEKTIGIHARLARTPAATSEPSQDRFKNFSTQNERRWEEALREATRERTLFE
ncbi:MAG TPA: hypothetical protein VJZ00_18475 [Thermoanaerobaculia bacterium]|nr:hypothetical protein [Thermoanaerobaculia bacterium]